MINIEKPLIISTSTPLNQVLEELGFTTKQNDVASGVYATGLKTTSGKRVYDEFGNFISVMTAGNCWDYLKEKNLIQFEQ